MVLTWGIQARIIPNVFWLRSPGLKHSWANKRKSNTWALPEATDLLPHQAGLKWPARLYCWENTTIPTCVCLGIAVSIVWGPWEAKLMIIESDSKGTQRVRFLCHCWLAIKLEVVFHMRSQFIILNKKVTWCSKKCCRKSMFLLEYHSQHLPTKRAQRGHKISPTGDLGWIFLI